MSNRDQELHLLEDEIDRMDDQIKNHCIIWAQEHFLSLKESDKPEELKELTQLIDDLDSKIGSLRELNQTREDSQIRIKEIKKNESEKHKSMGDFYQLLGKRSFDIFKRGQISNSVEIDDIFAPLMEYEDKIRVADNELYKIRNKYDDSKVIGRLGGFFKKTSQTTRKKNAGDALQKQYKRTGEALISGGFFNEVAKNGLSDIYEEFQDKEAITRQYNEELSELTTKIDEIDIKIDDLSDHKGFQKGIKNLESALDEAETKLDLTYLRHGQELYGSEGKNKEPYRILIDSLNIDRNKKMSQKSALLIDIRVDELSVDLEKREKEISLQKEKIGREQEKLDSLKQDKIILEKKLNQLKSEHEEIMKTIKEVSND